MTITEDGEFDTRFAKDSAPRLLESFAEQVIIIDADGVEWSLPAIVGDEQVEERDGALGVESVIVRDVTLEKTNAMATFSGSVQVAGFEYAIESTEDGPGIVTAKLVRYDFVERSRENYREQTT